MVGIGVLLLILGFSSATLHLAGSPMTFRLMMLLEPVQPWIGLALGVLGAALVWAGVRQGTPKEC